MCRAPQQLDRTYKAVAAGDLRPWDQFQCGRMPGQLKSLNQCLKLLGSGGVSSVMRNLPLLLIPLLRCVERLPIGLNAVNEAVLV